MGGRACQECDCRNIVKNNGKTSWSHETCDTHKKPKKIKKKPNNPCDTPKKPKIQRFSESGGGQALPPTPPPASPPPNSENLWILGFLGVSQGLFGFFGFVLGFLGVSQVSWLQDVFQLFFTVFRQSHSWEAPPLTSPLSSIGFALHCIAYNRIVARAGRREL